MCNVGRLSQLSIHRRYFGRRHQLLAVYYPIQTLSGRFSWNWEVLYISSKTDFVNLYGGPVGSNLYYTVQSTTWGRVYSHRPIRFGC